MKSKKLWQAFALIFTYLLFSSIVACGGQKAFSTFQAQWWIPFVVGVALWIISAVFFLVRKQSLLFIGGALPINAFACGLFIAAFAVAKDVTLSFAVLPVFAVIIACCYLLYMAFLSASKLSHKVWYAGVSFVVFMLVSIFLSRFLCRFYCTLLDLSMPEQSGWLFLFFYLILGFLALGSIVPAHDRKEMVTALIAPAICVTCFVGVIVVIAALCGDGGDCDCGCEGCAECFIDFAPTEYKKKKTTTFSEMSKP